MAAPDGANEQSDSTVSGQRRRWVDVWEPGMCPVQVSCSWLTMRVEFKTMHDWYLPTYLMRACPIISTRTRTCAFSSFTVLGGGAACVAVLCSLCLAYGCVAM